jgi:hypothetical protein
MPIASSWRLPPQNLYNTFLIPAYFDKNDYTGKPKIKSIVLSRACP